MVGFTCGTFDLLHTGHILMLEECRKTCQELIVGLQTDPTIDRPKTKNSPVQSMFERYIQLAAVRYVDKIIPYDTEHDLVNMLKSYNPNIRYVGMDYLDKDFTGKQYCIDNGIELFFHLRRHQYSSTELRNRVYTLEKEKRKESIDMEVLGQYSPELLNKYFPDKS